MRRVSRTMIQGGEGREDEGITRTTLAMIRVMSVLKRRRGDERRRMTEFCKGLRVRILRSDDGLLALLLESRVILHLLGH